MQVNQIYFKIQRKKTTVFKLNIIFSSYFEDDFLAQCVSMLLTTISIEVQTYAIVNFFVFLFNNMQRYFLQNIFDFIIKFQTGLLFLSIFLIYSDAIFT